MNSLKVAFRSLKKEKFYTAINVLGLSISLAASILVILWVQDERNFDKFHPDYKRVFKVHSHLNPEQNGPIWTNAPGPVVNFARELPQVERATRISRDYHITLVNDAIKRPVTSLDICYVDTDFFDLFNFPLVDGTLSGFHADHNHALVTESTAKKLFDDQPAIGKTFRYGSDLFSVSGILKDVPQNSSVYFDVLIPLAYHAQRFTKWGGNGNWKTIDEDLGNYSFQTFVKAIPGADLSAIGESLTAAYTKVQNGDNTTRFVLAPLDSLHLIARDGNKSALRMVQIFSLIAILLLIIGAVNYVNLSTARALDRAKDTGIRKVVGASRTSLFMQFVIETTIVFCISLFIAAMLLFLLQSSFNEIAQKSMSYSLRDSSLWIYVGLAIFGALCLSSIYPAIQLSAFRPLESLKGNSSRRLSSSTMRKVLVVFQFTISVTLIVCTLIIRNQLMYIQQINLGYDKEHVLTVNLPENAVKHIDAIHTELTANSAIRGVALAGVYNVTDYNHSTGDIEWPGKAKNNTLVVSQATIDKDFIPLMGIELLEGTNFSGLPADSSSYIINETLAKQMGLTPPYVGAEMSFHDVPGRIIGVVSDFHFKSVKEKIGPLVFWTRWGANTLYVKTNAGLAQQAIQAVETIYNRYQSDTPFSYTFVDSQFDELYKSERRTGTLFNIFSCIAICISALGLFALATHDAKARVKEIGIRKVLGASVFGVVRLLGKNFVVLVCISILIAYPVAFYLMTQWLGNFAYKVEMGIGTFILGSIIAVTIAVLTISYQAIRAARANPVDSLRNE